jgi:hypothetical protein
MRQPIKPGSAQDFIFPDNGASMPTLRILSVSITVRGKASERADVTVVGDRISSLCFHPSAPSGIASTIFQTWRNSWPPATSRRQLNTVGKCSSSSTRRRDVEAKYEFLFAPKDNKTQASSVLRDNKRCDTKSVTTSPSTACFILYLFCKQKRFGRMAPTHKVHAGRKQTRSISTSQFQSGRRTAGNRAPCTKAFGISSLR